MVFKTSITKKQNYPDFLKFCCRFQPICYQQIHRSFICYW